MIFSWKIEARAAPVRACWLAAAAAAAMTVGCSGPPERTLDVVPALDLPESLPAGHPIDLGYQWAPGENFTPPADDYKVFLHITDPDGTIFQQDDHFSPLPTSQWRPGEMVTYRHWIYPPEGIQPDYIDFYVGLYDEIEGRVAVMWDGGWEDRPRAHRIHIRTDDLSGQPVRVEGWHGRELSLSSSTESWYWTKRSAVAAFDNPRGPAVLHLFAHSPISELGSPQLVTLRLGEQEVATLEVTESTPFAERIEIPASAMGDGDWVELTLEVDRWFVPADSDPQATDTRELGLQVFYIYLAAGS